jgi:hypothetical protein
MSRRKRTFQLPSPSAFEDAWLRQATVAAIAAARAVVSAGTVPPMTPVGCLSDTEWGWVVASILFAWIRERATQATSSGLNGQSTEQWIQKTGLNPDPWDAGAIAVILPELAGAKVDWTASLAELSRDEMIEFLGAAYSLISKAMLARDLGEKGITRQPPTGPTTEDTPWNDPIPAFTEEKPTDEHV